MEPPHTHSIPTDRPRSAVVAIPADQFSGPRTWERSRLATLIETSKPGITRLVVITSAVGFAMAALVRPDWTPAALALGVVAALVGTGLSAAGANALNMWFEADRDERMQRTAGRPIPSGRATPKGVFWFGAWCSLAGVGALVAAVGVIPALLALVSIISYVLIYTPLKSVTPWSTLVGAIPGALPPLIGASAAVAAGDPAAAGFAAALSPIGLAIFALMVVWQIPHFLAIAWLYRGDYRRGNICVLPTRDPSGRATAAVIFATTALLLPATLLPAFTTDAPLGLPYLCFAGITWIAFAGLVLRWSADRGDGRARVVFIGSIIHLPLLLIAMVVEGALRTLVL